MRSRTLTIAVLLLLVPTASAHELRRSPDTVAEVQAASAPSSCPGRALRADRVITGEFGTELTRGYVMLPFEVPARTTAVRVKYCYDKPELSTTRIDHTLDLGLYEPRRGRSTTWGPPEFRGWGGSSHPDVTVSAEGFSRESQYLARPRVEVPGKTTRAFRPGRIRPGLWAVELGVGYVVPRDQGDRDGRVGWRVEIELPRNPAFADEPYRAARYDTRPAVARPGWYAGDFHVHAEHSDYGAAGMTETFEYAFGPARLDFIALSDYVAGSSWGEVGRYQARHRGKLVVRSAEVITYRGHVNAHNTTRVMDYREGPIWERRDDGSLVHRRGSRDAEPLFGDIHRVGGYTQISHPAHFDLLPGGDSLCRGCSWDYSTAETRYSAVDGIEVATGPSGFKTQPVLGPNPLTVIALDFYDRALATGSKIAAIGSSDSHNAGRVRSDTGFVTQAPIGEATTVVYAEELSEPGIECGVEAGHTYVKHTGNDGPDLRFEAVPRGSRGRAIFGDTVRAASADFTALVKGGAGMELRVLRNGDPVAALPVTADDFAHRFTEDRPGRYGLELRRGSTIETTSSPIYLTPGPGAVDSRDCRPLRVRGSARRVSRVRSGRFATRCLASGARVRSCSVAAVIRSRRRNRAVGRGRVRMGEGSRRIRVRLNRRGRRLLARHAKGRRVRLLFVVSDGDGAEARGSRRTRLVRR